MKKHIIRNHEQTRQNIEVVRTKHEAQGTKSAGKKTDIPNSSSRVVPE